MVKDVEQLKKDAQELRAIADDIEKGIVQSIIVIGKRKDDYISLTPFGINETRELRNVLEDAIYAKFLRENIGEFIKYVEV